VILVIESDATNDIQFFNGTSTLLNMTSSGEQTLPLQPAMLSIVSPNLNNVTGDGTNYTVVWNNEIYDQGNDFTSPTFTAPVTGKYLICVSLGYSGLDASTSGEYGY